MIQIEHFFLCPYCNANISILIDLSNSNQEYIEDCEVCCRPLEIKIKLENDELKYFEATAMEQ